MNIILRALGIMALTAGTTTVGFLTVEYLKKYFENGGTCPPLANRSPAVAELAEVVRQLVDLERQLGKKLHWNMPEVKDLYVKHCREFQAPLEVRAFHYVFTVLVEEFNAD